MEEGGTRVATPGSAARAAIDSTPPPGLLGVAEALATDILLGDPDRKDIAAATRDAAAMLSLTVHEAALLLHRLVARDPLFLRADPGVAMDGQVRALVLLAPLSHASLWFRGTKAAPVCVAAAGATEPRRPIRTAAAQALEGTAAPNGTAEIRTTAVRVETGWGVLVVHTRKGKRRAGMAHASEAAAALSAILDRRHLLDRALHSTAQMLAAVDQRIMRFGFDLHDGPLQGASVLVGELENLSHRLPALVPGDDAREVSVKMTELQEIAAGVAGELRELARAASGRGTDALAADIRRAAHDLERRAGVTVNVRIEGDVERITDSQRIAVARVAEEALANVQEHSRARNVRIALRREVDELHLEIADDGRGFDVKRARANAADEGRLGLESMHQRVRLLGGRIRVDSRRGGPTKVTAWVPAWNPSELRAQLPTGGGAART